MIQDGYGLSLSEIRNMCEEERLEISNNLINQYLADELGEQFSYVILIVIINKNLSFYQSLI